MADEEQTTQTPHLNTAATPKGSPGKPRLVAVQRKSAATGDKAHFQRQIVKRPWQR